MLRAHQSSGSRSLKHLSFPPVLSNAEAVRSDPVSQSHLCGTSRPCHRLRAAGLPPVEPTRSLPEPSQTQTQDWARTCRRPPKSCARELLILGILGSATHISHACTRETGSFHLFLFRQNRPAYIRMRAPLAYHSHPRSSHRALSLADNCDRSPTTCSRCIARPPRSLLCC